MSDLLHPKLVVRRRIVVALALERNIVAVSGPCSCSHSARTSGTLHSQVFGSAWCARHGGRVVRDVPGLAGRRVPTPWRLDRRPLRQAPCVDAFCRPRHAGLRALTGGHRAGRSSLPGSCASWPGRAWPALPCSRWWATRYRRSVEPSASRCSPSSGASPSSWRRCYLVRSLAITPAALIGGLLWSVTPALPFWMAAAIGIGGVLAFISAVEERYSS
jgi:hypothetical protein